MTLGAILPSLCQNVVLVAFIHPDAPWGIKKKKGSVVRGVLEKETIDSAVGDSVHIHIIRSLKDAAVKKPAYLYSDINALRKKMTCPRSHNTVRN